MPPRWRCTCWPGCCAARATDARPELTGSLRLFVALELPLDAVEALVEWQQAVVSARAGLRVVARESLHVTLCFLGSGVPNSAVEDVIGACRSAQGHEVTGLALGSPVWLPRSRPRVLAVAIEDDVGALRSLQEVVAAALVRAGAYEPEVRLFFPHVTVARVDPGARVRAATLTGPRPVEFAAEAVTLYRSRLGRGPAVYEPLHRVALAAG